jgi:hypothetical protein
MEISGIYSSRWHSHPREACRFDKVEGMEFGWKQPDLRAAMRAALAAVGKLNKDTAYQNEDSGGELKSIRCN